MRIFLLIMILACFINCSKTDQKETKFYPNKAVFNSEKIRKLNFENLNFKETTNLVEKIHARNELPFIEFNDENKTKKILILRSGGSYKERNTLRISQDSIFSIINNYSIDSLNSKLQKHYFNNNKWTTQ